MTAAVAIVVAWILLIALGWATGSTWLTGLGGLVLIPLPVAIFRSRRRTLDLLEPGWLLFGLFGFTYCVVPVGVIMRPEAFNSIPGYLDYPAPYWALATVLGGLGYIALCVGYWSDAGRVAMRILPRSGPLDATRACGLTAVVLFVAGLGSVAWAILLTGGLHNGNVLGGASREAIVGNLSGRGYLSVGFIALAVSIPCAAAWAAARRTRGAWRLVAVGGLIALVALVAIVGSRLGALTLILGTVVVIHYRVRRLATWMIATILAACGIAAVLILVIRQGTAVTGPVSALGYVSQTLDGFTWLVDAMARVRHFVYGKSIVQDISLTFFPRALWPDKPAVFGAVALQETVSPGLYRSLSSNATYPVGLVGEGYLNFGVVGAVLIPFISGVLVRAISLRLFERVDIFYVVVTAWLLPNELALIRGLGAFVPLLVLIGLMASLILIRERRRIRGL
jgi:oligosaccharide repeat unit polymerase